MRPILPVALLAAALLANPAFGDWKTFIHGEPPPFVKAPPPKQLAEVSTLAGVQPDPQVESFMRTLADAVMAREGSMILPRLSERYAVDGAPDDAKASDFMVQAIGKMPGPVRIVIRSVEANGGDAHRKGRLPLRSRQREGEDLPLRCQRQAAGERPLQPAPGIAPMNSPAAIELEGVEKSFDLRGGAALRSAARYLAHSAMPASTSRSWASRAAASRR